MYFVDVPELFDREAFMPHPRGDYPDNAERFGTFCRAVLEASKVIGVPDIFHVHDWQAAMAAVMLRSIYYFDPVFVSRPRRSDDPQCRLSGWFLRGRWRLCCCRGTCSRLDELGVGQGELS